MAGITGGAGYVETKVDLTADDFSFAGCRLAAVWIDAVDFHGRLDCLSLQGLFRGKSQSLQRLLLKSEAIESKFQFGDNLYLEHKVWREQMQALVTVGFLA